MRLVDYRVSRDSRHDFHIRLPDGWGGVRQPCEPPEGPVSRVLAQFVTADDLESSVEVRCAKIERELDPLDFLELHLEQDGATVIDKQRAWTLGGHVGELLVHRPIDGGRAATVARVEKDAELCYFVFGHTTVAGFDERADTLRDIVRSFRLLHPDGGLAEPLLFGGARFPVDHSFLFPASFELVADPSNDGALAGYELVHKEGADGAGFISVVAIARRETDHENGAEVAAWTQRALRNRGLELGSLELVDAPPLARELPTQMAHGEGSYGGIDVETELHVARHAQAWLVLARATPHRKACGAVWLASRRAFTIVRERFAVLPHPEPPDS